MATLSELVTRFKTAGTTDETAVLSPEELADPKTRSLADLAKQSVAAEQKTVETETKKQQEEQASKEKMATAFGLSPEEKARYIAPPKSPLATMPMPAASTAPTPATTEPTEKKQVSVTPPAPSKGGAETSPAGTDTTGAAQKEQQKKATLASDIDTAIAENQQILQKLGGLKSDKDLKDDLAKLIDTLNTVDVSDKNLKNDPVVRNFEQDRADIFRAYKEKADRNEWLDLAQNLVGSLTQFASAQAAIGTGKVGGGLPLPRTDYGARTEQAFKEYRAQTSDIEELRREDVAERDRIDRLRKEDLATQRATIGEKIAAKKQEIRDIESWNEGTKRDAAALYSAINRKRQQDIDNEIARDRITNEATKIGGQVAKDALNNQIAYLEEKRKQEQAKLDSANDLLGADNKHYPQSLSNFSTKHGAAVSSLTEEAGKKASIWKLESKKSWLEENVIAPAAADAQKRLQEIDAQVEALKRQAATGRVAPPPAPPAATPAPSTAPAAGGKVTLRDPVSGQTRQVVWDAAAQAKVNAGKLEIVK